MSQFEHTISTGASYSDRGNTIIGGFQARWFRVYNRNEYTHVDSVDRSLSSFELAIFLPERIAKQSVPVFFGLEGIAAPYQRLSYVVPAVVKQGWVCVLFETPFSGTRTLITDNQARNPLTELSALGSSGAELNVPFMGRLLDGVSTDFGQIIVLLEDVLGIRVALERSTLFGISFGCLLSSAAFLKHGFGRTLLGAIGHADVGIFAGGLLSEVRRYFRGIPVERFATGLAGQYVKTLVQQQFGYDATGVLNVIRLLQMLKSGGKEVERINPLNAAGTGQRRYDAHFLAGQHDELARPDDVTRSAGQIPGSTVRVNPCLAHGYTLCGPDYRRLIVDFVSEHLASR